MTGVFTSGASSHDGDATQPRQEGVVQSGGDGDVGQRPQAQQLQTSSFLLGQSHQRHRGLLLAYAPAAVALRLQPPTQPLRVAEAVAAEEVVEGLVPQQRVGRSGEHGDLAQGRLEVELESGPSPHARLVSMTVVASDREEGGGELAARIAQRLERPRLQTLNSRTDLTNFFNGFVNYFLLDYSCF